MTTTSITANMNLVVPTVGEDPGPDWATNLNQDLNAIDSHDHSTGKGVPVTPAGMDISDDLPFNSNNATELRSVRFDAQSGVLTDPTDVGCLYEAGVDLYYNDGAGNRVRITQGGSVSGSTGTITGLPSGTASAAYAAGTFTFQSATNTPATLSAGPYVMGQAVASGYAVTTSASPAQAANWGLVMPAAAPANSQFLLSDGSGNYSWTTYQTYATTTFSGALVGATTSPSITFRYTRYGNLVCIRVPTIATVTKSGSGTISVATVVPSAIRPPEQCFFIINILKNGAFSSSTANLQTDGTITIYADNALGSFANADTFATSGAASLSYTIQA